MNAQKKVMYAKVVGIALIVALVASLITYQLTIAGFQGAHVSLPFYIGAPQPCSYVIDTNGTHYFAYNGTTGQLEYYSTNASAVINNAFGNLTSGRTWQETVYLKGNVTITNTLLIPAYTNFMIDGKIMLATSSNCDMIRNAGANTPSKWSFSTCDFYITIQGVGRESVLDGGAANQSSGNGIYLNWTRFTVLEGLTLSNIKDDCVHIYEILEARMSHLFLDCPDYNYSYRGIFAQDFSDSWLSDCVIEQGGFFNGGGDSLFVNLYFGGSGLNQQLYINTRNSLWSSIRVDSSSKNGIEIGGISGGSALSNIEVTRPHNSDYKAVVVNGASHIRITNALLGQKDEADNTPYNWSYGIYELGGSNYNIYSVIDFKNCTASYTGLGNYSHVVDSLFGATWYP